MLWPGFRGMVRHGRWSFLGIAVLFALFVDTFLILEFYWTAQITPIQRNMILFGLLVAWIVLSILAGLIGRMYDVAEQIDQGDEKYRLALSHYLRGNWFETESILLPLLKKNPRDVEILLFLATLYRHTMRLEEAEKMLERLDLLEPSRRWILEMEREKHLINKKRTEENYTEKQAA
ncbi:MAG: tetratricopeptide repeat protein [Thermoguttaceae bacterium]